MIAASIERDFWIFFSPLQAAVVIERLGGRESKNYAVIGLGSFSWAPMVLFS